MPSCERTAVQESFNADRWRNVGWGMDGGARVEESVCRLGPREALYHVADGLTWNTVSGTLVFSDIPHRLFPQSARVPVVAASASHGSLGGDALLPFASLFAPSSPTPSLGSEEDRVPTSALTTLTRPREGPHTVRT